MLGSARSSPGVTTAVLALAGAVDGSVLVVEASRDAGVIAPRFEIPHEPGLTTLAAAMRHDTDNGGVQRHAQALPGTDGRVGALVGPSSHDAATMAVAAAADQLGRTLAEVDATVLVDAGRLDPSAPALALCSRVDAVVLVARPRAEDAQAVASLLPVLRERSAELLLLVRGTQPYRPAEVAETLGVELLGTLPDDPRAAETLAGAGRGRRLGRSALLREAGRVIGRLDDRVRGTDLAAAAVVEVGR